MRKILPALDAQVKMADIVLLNKMDLATEEQADDVEAAVRKLNPAAEIHRTVKCKYVFTRDTILLPRERRAGRLRLCSEAPAGPETVEFSTDKAMDRKLFYETLDKWRHGILRGKGVVEFGTGRSFVEVVNGAVSSRPAGDIELGSPRRTAMTFHTYGIDTARFKRELGLAGRMEG